MPILDLAQFDRPKGDQRMLKQLANFLRDDRGCVPATEWMLVASILTLGTIGVLMTLHYAEDCPDDSLAMLLSSLWIQK
jgi:Flp pilus assembly pilin Flp